MAATTPTSTKWHVPHPLHQCNQQIHDQTTTSISLYTQSLRRYLCPQLPADTQQQPSYPSSSSLLDNDASPTRRQQEPSKINKLLHSAFKHLSFYPSSLCLFSYHQGILITLIPATYTIHRRREVVNKSWYHVNLPATRRPPEPRFLDNFSPRVLPAESCPEQRTI